MLSSGSRISLLAAAVVLAACDGSPSPTSPTAMRLEHPSGDVSSTSGAVRDVQESPFDMSGSLVSISCADGQESELVALEGKVFERFTVLLAPSGGFHATYHTMPVGLRGTGTESGEEYRVKEQEHGSYTQTLMGNVGTYRQTFRLTARTSGSSFALVARGHYTITANGEIVVERDRVATECQG